MTQRTIDVGIDLGTTNSSIAVIDEVDARILPNKGGSSITPSALWIDKRGKLLVGQEAKRRGADDWENAYSEFKLDMGRGADDAYKTFARNGRKMTPIDASAEVLKSLRTDYQSSTGRDATAAVITVPAAFEKSSTNATMKAAQLAGLAVSPLLLEPVAASLAYGFQSERENEYWFVYDFGGGTFDAAIMSIRDGLIEVVNHDGDNFLGGKLIDWDIVEKLIVPSLQEQYNLPDLHRSEKSWLPMLNKIKIYAEMAKIEVCRTRQSSEIWIENICKDADGKDVDVEFDLSSGQVEELTLPWLEKSLRLCTKTLSRKGLKGSDLKRILLVGGSTLNPWIRDGVKSTLGDQVEFGIDPVTVVARGAAIFASTQIIPEDIQATTASSAAGSWKIAIEGDPVGNVNDPDIGGRVEPPNGEDVKDYTIELVDKRTNWRTGRITLGTEGVFMTNLYAEKQRRHTFEIFLHDPFGTRIPTTPNEVSYTIGIVPTEPPSTMTIGVGLANGQVATYVEKGEKLPCRRSKPHVTTVSLRAGETGDELRIPLLEGENPRADRNHGIGSVVVKGTDIRRDLPAGSSIDITVAVDKDQQVRVQAYIPTIDEDIPEVTFNPEMVHNSVSELRKEIEVQTERLRNVRSQDAGDIEGFDDAVEQLDKEKLVDEIENLSRSADADPEAVAQLDRRLRYLAASIDHLEDLAEWPKLLEKAEESKTDAIKVVGDFGDTNDKARLSVLQAELQLAIDSRDPELLRRQAEELDVLYFVVLDHQPGFHVGRFEWLIESIDNMRDRTQAEQIVAQGRRAITNGDTESLKAANRQLMSMLPKGEQSVPKHANEGDLLHG